MTDSTTSAEVIKNLVQVFSVAVGWYVVHKLSEGRDRNKARREMLAKAADGLHDEVGKLMLAAREYHLKERDKSVEDNLKMTLQDLSARTSLLADICLDVKELASCRSAIISLKKAITAYHFEDEHLIPLMLGDSQLQTIISEGLRVKQCFLRLKHKQFPPL